MNRSLLFIASFVVAAACGPTGTPILTLKAIETNTGARIDVTATNGDGTVGKGVVKLVASVGALESDSLTLDEYGTASTFLACDPVADSACRSGRVVATWTPVGAKEPVEEQVRLSFPPPGVDGGTGGGAGGGGGSTVVFVDGLRLVDNVCAPGVIPRVIPQCCQPATNQLYGTQHPRCAVHQIESGATLKFPFEYRLNPRDPLPTETAVLDVTLDMPSIVRNVGGCTGPKGFQVTHTDGAKYDLTIGHIVVGRINTAVWASVLDGTGTTSTSSGAVQDVCVNKSGLPDRTGMYVIMEGFEFFAADGTKWESTENRRFIYTVELAF